MASGVLILAEVADGGVAPITHELVGAAKRLNAGPVSAMLIGSGVAGSAVATADVLKRWGVKRIKFVGVIGAPEGIRHMQDRHPDVPIYLAAIDDHLNEKGYIIPGLGDAGDRQFGTG